MAGQKFYAVRSGLRPGIYHSWADCKQQTSGVSGAIFKSFSTQEAADKFLQAGQMSCKQPSKRQKKQAPTNIDDHSSGVSLANVADSPDIQHTHKLAGNDGDTAQQDVESCQPEVAPWLDASMTYRLVGSVSFPTCLTSHACSMH